MKKYLLISFVFAFTFLITPILARATASVVPAPVNGGWTDWSPLDNNNCGEPATQTRSCTNPSPSNGGSICEGESTQTITNPACLPTAINGGWSEWSTKSEVCGFSGTQTRTCTNPSPENGGLDCSLLDGGNSSRSYTNDACPVVLPICEKGTHLDGEVCILDKEEIKDICLNIDGVQSEIPDGKYLNGDGECLKSSSSRSHVVGGFSSATGGQVLGASTSCGIYIDKFLRKGYKNDEDSVKKIQQFLNDYLKAGLKVDGIFGDLTEKSLMKFQEKNSDTILKPWNLLKPTGIFYQTTQAEVNKIMCPDLDLKNPELIPFEKNPKAPKI